MFKEYGDLINNKALELGVISPSEFMPIAEEAGIIIELGRYVRIY